jgi:lysozyme
VRWINKAGLDLIRDAEGLRLKAYPDPGTGGEPWTVGYGHTGPDVVPGLIITADRATVLLVTDLATAEDFVAHAAPICTDNQFAALVSFAFNCGRRNLQGSTLLRLHNQGDYAGAQPEFKKWIHADGKVMQGLVKRRAAEAFLYGRAA